ncbi:hypothetical protein [Loktanella sp. S4079]|uniref:hypothetical protein n=1 Tax=Loktanella sp. S4079 TaxID=579483 RepID=UPI0005FA69C2|nr:hypothetical protein [Loktanella sp. S4079]KJZ19559.1 hypothetical protein TW80_01185 [Loktanella sp. S4079]
MFRLILPVAICIAQSANAQSGTQCALTEDNENCNRVVACVGTDGLWFNGRAFGRGTGTFAGSMSNGVSCDGTWVSRNAFGLGEADVSCDDGMTGKVLYTYQDPYTGTAVGRGLTSDGRPIQIWSGNNVLRYLREDTGKPVAMLPCAAGAIPMS